MDVKITSTQDFESFFEDYVKEVLSSSSEGLPPFKQQIGPTTASWFECEPGTFHLSATGGTLGDRALAQAIVSAQLEPQGFKRAAYTFGSGDLMKTSAWQDIEAKAKRLIESGKVHVLRNSGETIVGHVEGDHGNYEPEIWRNDPNSQAISLWDCTCLLPGTPIVMYDGSIKPVEEVQSGDVVLTATGHAGIVGKLSSRQYDGEIIGHKVEGSTETVWTTDNHKIPTPEIEFKEAKDWKAGDYTYMPQPTYPEIQEIDVAKHVPGLVEYEGRLFKPNKLFGSKRLLKAKRPTSPLSPRQKPVPARIKWDCNFAYLCGLFVAEGIATPRGELRWSFNDKTEHHLADWVIKALSRHGLDNAKKKSAKGCVTVSIQSKPMADLFISLFGTGSKTKKLSLDVLGMPQLCLASFFGGWFEGDGHEAQNQRDVLSTASPHLAMQARLILALCGHESVVRVNTQNASPLVPNGATLYTLSWRRNGGKGQLKRWHEDRQVHQRMLEPQRKQYSGPVYNFEVLDYHTYVMGTGIASANCPWDQFAWQRTRQWKKYEGRPCAHVLALYWKALATPLDEESEPGTGPTTPNPSVPGGAAPIVQGQPSFNPTMGPEQASPGSSAPTPPGVAAPPPELIPQFPGNPELQPQVNPVSVPGGKPQSPLNPMQNFGVPGVGGTFSSWQRPEPTQDPDDESFDSLYNWEAGTHDYDPRWDYSDELRPDWENHPLTQTAKQRLQQHVGDGGRVFAADFSQHGSQPVGMFISGTGGAPVILFDPYAHEDPQHGLTPEEAHYQAQKTIDHEIRHAHQEQEGQDFDEDDAEGWVFEGRVANEEEFKNGVMVVNKKPEWGTAVGLNGGESVEIPMNSQGEVLGQDPVTGMVEVYFAGPMGQRGNLEPHGVQAFFFPSELTIRPDIRPPGPAIRRR